VFAHGRGERADVRGDVTVRDDVARAVESARPDVVINLVGLTNVDACERDPDGAYRLNVQPVEHLVDILSGQPGHAHLIHISTDQVYDAPGENPESAVVLRNTYALTKLWAERVAGEMRATVLRTNFFGRSHTPGRTSLSDWIVAGGRAGKEMVFFTDVFFSPLSVETLNAALARVVEQRHPGVYNLGSAGGMSKRDFAHLIGRRLGLDLSAARDGVQTDLRLEARRPSGMAMDSARFEKKFNFKIPMLEHEIQTAEL
jgi:dTDP-4-dehydrorhamnose reductase